MKFNLACNSMFDNRRAEIICAMCGEHITQVYLVDGPGYKLGQNISYRDHIRQAARKLKKHTEQFGKHICK